MDKRSSKFCSSKLTVFLELHVRSRRFSGPLKSVAKYLSIFSRQMAVVSSCCNLTSRFFLGKAVGEMMLFFGCRKKSEDYIYEDELVSYSQDGTIEKLHVAFSRDQVRFIGIVEISIFNGFFLIYYTLLHSFYFLFLNQNWCGRLQLSRHFNEGSTF